MLHFNQTIPTEIDIKKYAHFLKKNKNNKKKYLKPLQELHNEVTQQVACLDCGNCCKTYSPRFKTTDIKRISKYLKLKESIFIHTYLKLDTDGDYVLNKQGCYFLDENNVCSIYENRPTDCKRFPYSDEDVFFNKPAITLKNITFCPIAYNVIEGLIKV